MITHQAPKNARSAASRTRSRFRRGAVASAVGLFALVTLPVAAFADEPASWATQPHVSGLQFLIVLVLIPAGLFVLISLCAALPSLIKDKGYEPGQSWRSEAEWFGGPRKGVEAADGVSSAELEAAETDQGGTSGKW